MVYIFDKSIEKSAWLIARLENFVLIFCHHRMKMCRQKKTKNFQFNFNKTLFIRNNVTLAWTRRIRWFHNKWTNLWTKDLIKLSPHYDVWQWNHSVHCKWIHLMDIHWIVNRKLIQSQYYYYSLIFNQIENENILKMHLFWASSWDRWHHKIQLHNPQQKCWITWKKKQWKCFVFFFRLWQIMNRQASTSKPVGDEHDSHLCWTNVITENNEQKWQKDRGRKKNYATWILKHEHGMGFAKQKARFFFSFERLKLQLPTSVVKCHLVGLLSALQCGLKITFPLRV